MLRINTSFWILAFILINFETSFAKFVNSENQNEAESFSELNRQVRQDSEQMCEGVTPEVESTVITTPDSYIDKALQATNELRRKHGVADLQKSDKLCKIAQYWANKMAATRKFDHSPFECGENIWGGMSFDPIDINTLDPNSPIQSWYSEINHYDFKKGQSTDPNKMTFHFTQLLWKETKYHCMAVGLTPDKMNSYMVAEYWPRGNYPGAEPENVFPAGTGK